MLLVLIDDAGFGNPSTFGGPIATPAMTRVADEGARYNAFHVTALCSPTRAALLTGRNHHAVGFGSIGELSSGFPGYTAFLPQDCAPFPKVLQMNGYSTAAFGKWHLTPDGQQGPAGPFDRWPTAWGFDHFWGFLGGEAGQYDTVITQDQTTIGVPEDPNFYLPDAMTDKTIEWLHAVRAQESDKPWFVYYSTGCSHAPHQVREEWSARYKGKFDTGWDAYREETFARQKAMGVIPADAVLTPRNDAFPAWDSMPADQQQLYARQMEVYAGFCENADWNVGRLLDAIEHMGELDDTLVIYIWGDNGCSMEGTVTGTFNELTMQNGIPLTPEQQLALVDKYGGLDVWGTDLIAPHYAAAWRGQETPRSSGGSRWPRTSAAPATGWRYGGLRVSPTRAVCAPSSPTASTSVRRSSKSPGCPRPSGSTGSTSSRCTAPVSRIPLPSPLRPSGTPSSISRSSATVRCIRMAGCCRSCSRASRGTRPRTRCAGSPPRCGIRKPTRSSCTTYPTTSVSPTMWRPSTPTGCANSRNCSGPRPNGTRCFRFWGGMAFYFGIVPPLPAQASVTYFGTVQNVASGMIPRIYNHSYSISADLHIPTEGAEGVIVAEADHLGGFALFVQDGRLKHTYSMMGVQVYRQVADQPLPTGNVSVRMEFAADAPKPATGGQVTLFVNDTPVGGGRMDNTVPFRFSGYAGLDIGRDNGLPVDRAYADKTPFAFTGTVKKVVFNLKPHLQRTDEDALTEAAHHAAMAHGISA